MISRVDYLSLVGLALASIECRKATNNVEDILKQKLVECGVSEEDAEALPAVDRVLGILNVEVEPE